MNDKQLKAVAMPGDFIFHSSWFEIFKSFDMTTAYAIFMAMIAYVQTGEIPADEELRRLTVFLFAHIDTDRERILSLQPKRRSSTKKKAAEETPAKGPSSKGPSSEESPAEEPPAEPTQAETEITEEPSESEPLLAPSSDTSVTSVTSDTSDTSESACPRPTPPSSRRARFEKSVTRMVNEARKRKDINGQIKRKKRR